MTTKKTDDLIEAAEIGSGLLHQAICTADDEDDVVPRTSSHCDGALSRATAALSLN
jgi:hypothetical protein